MRLYLSHVAMAWESANDRDYSCQKVCVLPYNYF